MHCYDSNYWHHSFKLYFRKASVVLSERKCLRLLCALTTKIAYCTTNHTPYAGVHLCKIESFKRIYYTHVWLWNLLRRVVLHNIYHWLDTILCRRCENQIICDDYFFNVGCANVKPSGWGLSLWSIGSDLPFSSSPEVTPPPLVMPCLSTLSVNISPCHFTKVYQYTRAITNICQIGSPTPCESTAYSILGWLMNHFQWWTIFRA